MRIRHLRFTLRGLLAFTAAAAIAIPVLMAWPTKGSLIGPSIFLLSLLAALLLYFSRNNYWGRIRHRLSVAMLLFVTLLYASFGPASWAMARYNTPASKFPVAYEIYSYIYCPIATNIIFSPDPIRSTAIRYTSWWMPDNATLHDWGRGIGWSVPGWTYTVIHY